MAKISKNAKKLLALTLAGVMTVGTAVPGTVVSTTQDVQAADWAAGLTNDEKTEVQEIVNQITAKANELQYHGFYYEGTDTFQDAVSDWKANVLDKVDLASEVNVSVDNPTWKFSDNGIWQDGATADLSITLVFTLSTGTPVEYPYEISVSYWTAEGVANKLQELLANEKLFNNTEVVEVSSLDEATIRSVAQEKADTALQKILNGDGLTDDQKNIIADYFRVEMSESNLNVGTNGTATWTANVSATNKVSDSGDVAVSSSELTMNFKKSNSAEAETILKNIKPEAVTVTTATGTVESGNLEGVTDENGNYLFPQYFGYKFDDPDNAITKAIVQADADIQTATLSNPGSITGNPGAQSWIGTVTITLKDGSSATGTVTVPLNVEKKATEYTEISIKDDRTDKRIKVGENYDFDGVTVTLKDSKGKITNYVGNTAITGAIRSGILVEDKGSYNNQVLGTYDIALRIKGDNAKYVTVPVQVYQSGTVVASEINLTDPVKSIKSEDETILKGTGDGNYEVYKAGTVYATVSDTEGNSIRVKFVVDEKGKVSVSTDFESFEKDQIIGNDFAPYAKGQDIEVSVKDPEILSASYSKDSAGVDHVKLVPVAVGKTEVTVKFGTDKKLSYTYNATVKSTGEIILTLKGDTMEISSVSLPTATKKAFSEATYYGTELKDSNVLTMNGAKAKEGKKVIDDAVDTSKLLMKVTTTSGQTDTVPVSTGDYGFETATYTFEGSSIAVKFHEGTSSPVTKINLKNKVVCSSGFLKINPVSFEYVDDAAKYVEVITEKDENGNDVYAIIPKLHTNKSTSFSVIFKDKNDAYTTVSGNLLNYWLAADSGDLQVTYPPIAEDTATFVAPDKKTYTIGEKFDLTGASFSYKPQENAKTQNVDVSADMFFNDSNNDGKVDAGETIVFDHATSYTNVKFTYGTYVTDTGFTITVNPAEQKFSASELGVPADDSIASVRIKSTDTGIECGNYAEAFAYFTARKVNESAAVVITTTKGNTINVLVKVDENGKITAEGEIQFKGHQAVITAEELNLTPDKAESSDASVATAEVQGGKVIIKSLAKGTSTVTVADKDGNEATISVSVAQDGTITTTVHAYNADGWVNLGNGDWGYIKDGERVVSDWAYVIEADPYNNNEVGKVWYHFDAEGKMQRGWIADETGWKIYLLDSNGRMAHSQWVNAPAQESLNRPAGIYHLNDDGSVQMNGWALAKDSDSVYWLCNAGNGLFEKDNPASWSNSKLW